MDLFDLLKAINDGDFDADLEMIQGMLDKRNVALGNPPRGAVVSTVDIPEPGAPGQRHFVREVEVGETGRLHNVRPRYLEGAPFTVVGRNRTRVVVNLDPEFLAKHATSTGIDKWKGRVTCPLGMLVFDGR